MTAEFVLPNIKRLLKPDPGMVIGDFDLAQADAQVVAWEANDDELKAIFRDPTRDLHAENAKAIFGAVTKANRQLAKAGVHATNYGAGARTLASSLGITVAEAEAFIARWFDIHPGIRDWHEEIKSQLEADRTVRNAFGYQRQYFDRVERLFTEAVAWIPQSTVALVITKAIIRLHREHPEVDFLMQVHDSIVAQWRVADQKRALMAVKQCMEVEIPYDDPLVIPVGGAISQVSLGNVTPICLDCGGRSFYRKPLPEACRSCHPGLTEAAYT